MKLKYTPPEIVVVLMKEEKGYALSYPLDDLSIPFENHIELIMLEESRNNNSYQSIENYTYHSTWLRNDEESFWR